MRCGRSVSGSLRNTLNLPNRAPHCDDWRDVMFHRSIRCLLFSILLLYGGAGCQRPQPGAASLDELAQTVRSTLEHNDIDGLFRYCFTGNAPAELIESYREGVRPLWSEGAVITSVAIRRFADYHPEVKMPGQYQGRQLQWAAEPSHWIIAKAKFPPKNGATSEGEAVLPAFEKNNQWYIVGNKYAD